MRVRLIALRLFWPLVRLLVRLEFVVVVLLNAVDFLALVLFLVTRVVIRTIGTDKNLKNKMREKRKGEEKEKERKKKRRGKRKGEENVKKTMNFYLLQHNIPLI